MALAVDMPRTIRLFALLSAFLLIGSSAFPLSASAQEQQENEPALPDIAPREIEIRGTLEISLPSLQRQPLSGFNPPPRIPTIPATRTPYIGTYKLDRSELPQQMPEPPGLQARLDRPAPPLNGKLEAGGGRYFTRFANGQLWLPLSTQESLTIAGDYRGSSGFEPFDDAPNVETPFDTFEGEIGLQSRRDQFSLNTDLEGFFDTYTLYGARINPQSPLAPGLLAEPDRAGRHLAGSFDLQTHGRIWVGAHGRVSGTEYETTIFSGTSNGDSLFTERRIRVGGELGVPVGTSQATFDATFETAGLGANATFDKDVTAFDGGLGAEIATNPEFRLEVGGRFLAATVGADARPDVSERQSARFLVPTLQFDWTISPSATLYAHNQPGVATHPLANLFRNNPYLFGNTAVQPSLRTTDAEGGLRLFAGPFQFVARGGYRYVVSYQYFADGPSTSPSSVPSYYTDVFVPRYESARIIHGGAEVSLQRMQGFELSLGASYRDGQFIADDGTIPYFAPIIGQAVLSYGFADQKGLIQLTSTFEGTRYVDRTESADVAPYVDVDLEASYDVTSSLGIVFELRNMTSGSLERWPRYPHPPLVVTSGLRVQW